MDLQIKLQEAQTSLVTAEQTAAKATHAAEQRYIAVEERARLAEQVCTSPCMQAHLRLHCCKCS